ncbi:hypothetical protein M407DRAFT_85798, partial [Tulasnella calospora MUT 4182]
FLQASIQKRPDAYLSELARDLQEICDVHISETNVWRALHRSGFSRKQVRPTVAAFLLAPSLMLTPLIDNETCYREERRKAGRISSHNWTIRARAACLC